MIYLHKLLPLVVSPLGLILSLLILSIFLRRMWLTLLAILVLLISSLPLTANLIWADLREDYPYRSVNSLPISDVVVVLSGYMGWINTSEIQQVPTWGRPNRFFAGVDIIKAGKANSIIFTQERFPWADIPSGGVVSRNKALELGVPESQIHLSGFVSNTQDEAKAIKKLIDDKSYKKVILVTSSFHMPRAKAIFEAHGISVIPYATDNASHKVNLNAFSFIPSADGFRSTSNGIREYIGRFYYWLKYV